MKLTNNTRHRISKKWLQKMIDHLGVNPTIEIHYSDNPADAKPNSIHLIGKKYTDVDGCADDRNRVFIYSGKWVDGEFYNYTCKYLKWVILHELRHQYYYYHFGNSKDPWVGLSNKERKKREERACDRFANLIIGVVDKDFAKMRKDANKIRTTKKTSSRRQI